MFSTSELKARQARLLTDQHAAIQKEKNRIEKERQLRERERERERAREEETRQRKLAEAAAAEQAQREAEEELEHNRGVALHVTLQAVDDDASGEARGIKRSADKVLLPASLSHQLMAQDASKNGALLFELRSLATGQRTHAGVLAFSTPDGVIALPAKVRQCLFGHSGAAQGAVEVRYRRLDKGSFVRFQPLTRGFHEAVGGEVREVLEACLMRHATLTEGDVLRVDHAGHAYDLKVIELQPSRAVSLIDTDMEAEVVASEETEALVREWEEQQRRGAEALAAAKAAREAELQAMAAAVAAAAEEQVLQARQQAAATQAAQAAATAQQQLLAALEAALPPEPSASGPEPTVVCGFRLPDGARLSRRFLLSAPVAQLFDFVDAKGAAGLAGGDQYDLVTLYPRRRISRPAPPNMASEGSQGLAPTMAQGLTGHGGLQEPVQQQQQQEVSGTVPCGSVGGEVGRGGSGGATAARVAPGLQSSVSAPLSLQALGLGQGGQEMLLLEPKAAPS
ncbi:ubiquitin fusion degradation protein UFD1-domain-containing protein [Haematococcus lacustris]